MTAKDKKELDFIFKVASRILVVIAVVSFILVTFATIFLIN